jgi:hypothetical protein
MAAAVSREAVSVTRAPTIGGMTFRWPGSRLIMAASVRVSMNVVDHIISFFAPNAGIKRLAARRVLNQYEGQPSRLRKHSKDNGAPDLQVKQGAVTLRTLARNLEQNHDIARGALRTLVITLSGPPVSALNRSRAGATAPSTTNTPSNCAMPTATGA